MILTIKGADFSSANIGTLSTFVVSKSIGRGASFDIPSFVEKNSSVNWVITLGEDYTFGTYSVTMGGEVITPTVNDSEMTIAITNVTGNIRITVATVYNGVEELPDEPEQPDVPTPDEPEVITLYSFTGDDFIQGAIYQNGIKTETSSPTTEPYVIGGNKTRCCIRPSLALTVDSGAKLRLNIESTGSSALNIAVQSFGEDGAALFNETGALGDVITDTTWQTDGYEFNLPADDKYIWVVIKKVSNSNITPSDIKTVTISKIIE